MITKIESQSTNPTTSNQGISWLTACHALFTPRTSCNKSHAFSLLRFLGIASLFVSVRSQLFPAQIELSSLNGTDGFVLNGERTDDWSGRSVSSAGDVNADGIADLLIGAIYADPATGREDAGRTYVVFGKSGLGSGGTVELSTLNGSNGFILNGDHGGDFSGFPVAAAGDVNADGIADFLIGASYADPAPGREDAGRTYVVFGKSDLGVGGTLELSSLDGANGFVLNGDKKSDGSGFSVFSAEDVNADGVADLFIGANTADPAPGREDAGRAYVVFGKPGLGVSGTLELSSLAGSNGFVLNGDQLDDRSGFSVSSAGDLNGDGVSDLLIGAYGADPATGREQAGKTYVVFGRSGLGAAGSLELSSLNGTDGFIILGDRKRDQSGIHVSTASDVNADGISDLLIGAHLASPATGREEAGKAYVIFGKAGLGADGTLELSNLNGTDGFVLNGERYGDHCGISVSSTGDINADGIADLLIGAYLAAPIAGRETAGKVYVVFGKAGLGASGTLELSSLDGTNGFVLNGDKKGDLSGTDVSGTGDVNADGVADFLIGTRGADPAPGREQAGRTYVVFGRKPVVSSVAAPSTGSTTQGPPPSSMELATVWSPMASITDMVQAPSPSYGPDGTVIALVGTVVGLALSMCGGVTGLFLRHKLKASEKEKSMPIREPVYQEAQEQLTPVYATIPAADTQRESNYADWPREDEPVYEDLELREGSHYVENINDIMPSHESASESTS